nr:hypothetical protein [Suicoccus acidiformans]
MKACLGFTRFHVRGIDKAKNEIGLALMAANLRRLALRLSPGQKTQKSYSLRKNSGFFEELSYRLFICKEIHFRYY